MSAQNPSFTRIIKELASNDITIILVSSELPEIMTLCDRVLVMRDGAVTGEFIVPEASEENYLRESIVRSSNGQF